MSNARRDRDTANVNSSGVTQVLRSFFAMAVEEWWKLVADVSRVFGGKPNHPGDAIEEKRLGDQ